MKKNKKGKKMENPVTTCSGPFEKVPKHMDMDMDTQPAWVRHGYNYVPMGTPERDT